MAKNTKTNKKKVALGMSGGVDSSLCAHLLLEQGYEVTGVYLECWRAPGCRTEEDRKDALAIALSLGIPFQVLDFKETYRQKVVENFFAEYAAGRTPNPDVLCNKEVKFGLFYDWAIDNNFDYVATGHYAQIVRTSAAGKTPKPALAVPKDTAKDQTYFLYLLKQEQLEHILFPLADYTKQEVRQEAKKRAVAVADKKDSVGICFIGDIDVTKFLRERLGENPGEVVNTKGEVIGTHRGLWFYTIGQRHGFTIHAKTTVTLSSGETIDRHAIPPFYVIAKKPDQNQLVVGFGAETYSRHFMVTTPHWVADAPKLTEPLRCLVRIRHTGALLPCTITQKLPVNSTDSESATMTQTLEITLDTPAKGIAEGQSAVFYQEHEVVGSQNTASKTRKMLVLGGGVIA